MKTAIDWDSLRGKYGKKKSILAVFTKDRSKLLGEADFDLGKYANDPSSTKDQLALRNCEADPNAYIEIYIKAKTVDSGDQPAGRSSAPLDPAQKYTSGSFALAAIEEKNSEFDAKEELEKEEREYQKGIQQLEETLTDLQKTIDHKKEALVQIQNESMSNLKPASVLMDQRIKELTALDRELRLLEGN